MTITMTMTRLSDGTDDSLARVWDDAWACRRCVQAPSLSSEGLDENTYLAFRTIGMLPPGSTGADYVLVGSEPTPIFKSRAEAAARMAQGLRNHGDGRRAGCIQYSVERWLLRPGQGYYITDMAKCTVPVETARKTREPRYSLCASYLMREIDIVQPRAIVTIGLDAFRYLRDHRKPGWPAIFSVLHYSKVAQSHTERLLGADWRAEVPTESEFDAFVESRRIQSVRSKPHRPATVAHIKLLNTYRLQFGAIRSIIETGSYAATPGAMVRVSARLDQASVVSLSGELPARKVPSDV